MEAKLAEYRKNKEKTNKSSFLSLFKRSGKENKENKDKRDESASLKVNKIENVHDQPSQNDSLQRNGRVKVTGRNGRVKVTGRNGKVKVTDSQEVTAESQEVVKSTKVIWIERTLKFLIWILLWLLFSEYQFGVVYFISSLIVIVYFNTRTGPRDRRHLSAYSVFNPNFERIDGTFTAEQFEKELLHGAGSVKKD